MSVAKIDEAYLLKLFGYKRTNQDTAVVITLANKIVENNGLETALDPTLGTTLDTDELNGTAVRLSKNCVHELHQACYDTVIADKRTNTHCGMCWALIVKPVAPEKAGSSKVRRAVSTSERTKRLMQLDLMARDKKLFGGIAKSQELSALRDKREISQADYTAILGYVAKNDASGLIEFLKKFLRKRHALTRTHKVV